MENTKTVVAYKFTAPEGISDGYDTPNITENLSIGRSVRFRKGRFILGRVEQDLLGAILCAYRRISAWQQWYERRPIAAIIERPGQYFPRSVDEIQDIDSGLGEWQLTEFLYLRDLESGDDYTFTASSFGGRRAVENLVRSVKNMRAMRPACLPVVKLECGSFRSEKYGKIECPRFSVLHWVNAAGEPITTQLQKAMAVPSASPNKDLNDEIPF